VIRWCARRWNVALGATEITTGFIATGIPGPQHIEIPPARVASVIHRGPMSTVAVSYQTVVRWAVEHGYSDEAVAAAPRRLLFLDADGVDQSDWVVDVQLELP
jgi:effector-binding domain-containing protein